MDEEKALEQATSLALRFLSYRPRSVYEVTSRLRRRYNQPTTDAVVARLKEHGLLDDEAFARSWSRSRTSSRPRSAAMIRRELQEKGVDKETVQATTETLDDDENAYNAGLRAVAYLPDADYATFRRRLWGYLHRRGFGQSTIRRTVARLWEERSGLG